MIIEINEEEREFIERTCIRAKLFCELNMMKPSKYLMSEFKKDLISINRLIDKLKKESHD